MSELKSSAVSSRRILQLALPIILGGIAQNVILATDVIFMSRVDEVALDAVGIAGLFFSTVYIIGLGFSTGVQILIARRHGEKQHHAIGNLFDNSLLFLLLSSGILWLGMEVLGPPILKSLISSQAVYDSAIVYLDQRAWGITFALVNLAFRAFFIGISSSAVITWSTIGIALANGVLNYGLIFGNWGMPELGIAGAAIASSLSESAGLIIFLAYIFSKRLQKEFSLFESWKWDWPAMKQILNTATPVMFQYFISHAGWFLFFIVIEHNGERALAISVLVRMIYMFQMVPFWGFSAATNTLVSFAIGEGRNEQVIPMLKKITFYALLSCLPLVGLNLIAPEWVLGLAVDPMHVELVQDSIPTLYVISAALIFFALAMTWFSGVSGSGNTRTALWIETGAILVYLLMSYVLGIVLEADVHIIWLTEPCYFLMMGLVSFLYIRSGRWKGKQI